jgi:hypothetical protein
MLDVKFYRFTHAIMYGVSGSKSGPLLSLPCV